MIWVGIWCVCAIVWGFVLLLPFILTVGICFAVPVQCVSLWLEVEHAAVVESDIGVLGKAAGCLRL